MKPPFKNERAAWRELYGRANSKALRKEMQALFKELFPQGQRASLRPWIPAFVEFAESTEPVREPFGHLKQFHPDALRFIAKHGINQRAFSWKGHDPYNSAIQPEPRQCYLNARLFIEQMRDEEAGLPEMVYVEGIAFGSMVQPMLHAWSSRGLTDTVAYDWTFYATAYLTRYIGVPFTVSEHERALELLEAHHRQSKAILFSRENFPVVEPYLSEVLAKRRRQAGAKTKSM